MPCLPPYPSSVENLDGINASLFGNPLVYVMALWLEEQPLLPEGNILILPSYWGFSYLGRGVTLHGCYSKVQLLPLTLDKGYLLTASLPDLQCGIAPLGPPRAARAPWTWGWSSRPPSLASGVGLVFPAAAPGLGRGGMG